MVPTPQPRTVPLFDPRSHPQSWNERMADGEFAVLYAGDPIPPPSSPNDTPLGQPYSVLFSSMASSRRMPAGLVLLCIDVGIMLNRAQQHRTGQKS